jgi:hypothetical protein
MRTLGKPEGAARRAALAGIAAGLMIGLAACGTTVAGAGTAASGGPASRAPAVGAAATPQPSASGVNPGGVMIGVPPKHVALCRAVPALTRMTFMLSAKPPGLHVREVLPAGFPIRNRATVRQLAGLLCGLPAIPPGQMACPNDMGGSYRMFFFAGGRAFGEVTVELTGCRVVTGLGPPRSWSTSTALEQALSQHFGIRLPPAP